MGGSGGGGGVDRRGGGRGDDLGGGPILPVASWVWLGRNSNGHSVAPDISVSDSLAVVALAGGIPVASSVVGRLCDSDGDRAGSRAVGRLGSRNWSGSDWSGSGMRMVGSHDWVARSGGPDAGGQVGGIVSRTVRGSNWSRTGHEGGLGNVLSRSVGGVVGLGGSGRSSAVVGRGGGGHVVAFGGRC